MKWTNSYRSFGLKTKRSTGLKTIEHKQGRSVSDWSIWVNFQACFLVSVRVSGVSAMDSAESPEAVADRFLPDCTPTSW